MIFVTCVEIDAQSNLWQLFVDFYGKMNTAVCLNWESGDSPLALSFIEKEKSKEDSCFSGTKEGGTRDA